MSENFRFSAQRVLLTYSQTGELTKEEVLFTLQERYHIELYSLGQEEHEDGGWHIHCLLKFDAKTDSRDATLFDVNDGIKTHHPNIKPVKRGEAHWKKAHNYVEKEDPTPLCNIPHTLTWAELLKGSTTVEEYLAGVRDNYPRDYALNFDRLKAFAHAHFGGNVNTLEEGFQIDYEWEPPANLQNLVPNWNRSLVIVGPAGCGKTTWAKQHAPKPALFVRHLDSLSRFSNHKSIIFDDLDFKHMPPSAQKFLVDTENLAEIHVRYRVARIPEGVARIFTANEYPFTEDDIHGPAIDRRVNKIYL